MDPNSNPPPNIMCSAEKSPCSGTSPWIYLKKFKALFNIIECQVDELTKRFKSYS